MKHGLILIAAMLVVGVAAIGSCTKDTSKAKVQNITNNGCHMDAVVMSDDNKEIDDLYTFTESADFHYHDGVLYVTHHNLCVNCAFESGGIDVDLQVDGNTITVYEYAHDGDIANCVCFTDNFFQIANLPHGTYTFIFNTWSTTPQSFTITF
jgi:hypothetical protein